MDNGYNSVYSQYNDYADAVRIVLGAYIEHLKLTAPPEKLSSRAAAAARAEQSLERFPFTLTGDKRKKLSAVLSDIEKKSGQSEIFLPFDYICSEFSMSEKEKLAFAACFLRSIHPEFAEVFAFINHDLNLTFPTLTSVCAVFFAGDTETVYSALKSYIPLLFDVNDKDTDFSCIELKPRQRVLDLLLGMDFLYDLPYSHTFAVNEKIGELYGREKELSVVKNAFDCDENAVLLIEGANGFGKRFFVKYCGIVCKKDVIFVEPDKLDNPELAVLELKRETVLQRAICCFTDVTEQNLAAVERVITALKSSQRLILLTTEQTLRFKTIAVHKARLGDLSFEDKRKIWFDFSLPVENVEAVEKLSASYDFPPSKIRRIVEDCERAARLAGVDQISEELLSGACLAASEGILKDKASRIQTAFRLDDLILPQSEKLQILDGINYIKYRHTVYDSWHFKDKTGSARGLSMLFEGSPGTGKTMAASIIANELGLALFKVDLSKMMSKYIGDTEKSLDEVFNIAERSSAVLLFDETDALFGKRSEIKDSRDKYANVETSYLLQKMDEYGGIIIMTTNFKQNIDDAFMRRITYIIHFPQPDAALRLQLWENVFPKEAPVDQSVDCRYLAEHFEMTGAMIKGAAVSAAFSAAARGEGISMADVVPAVRKQFAKFGKNISPSDFGPYSSYIS